MKNQQTQETNNSQKKNLNQSEHSNVQSKATQAESLKKPQASQDKQQKKL